MSFLQMEVKGTIGSLFAIVERLVPFVNNQFFRYYAWTTLSDASRQLHLDFLGA